MRDPEGLLWEWIRVNARNEAVTDRVVHLVRDLIGPEGRLPEPLPLEQQLSELGVTSLKMVNLMLAVEVEFDLTIAPGDITPENFHSVATIARLVEKTLAPR